MTRRHRPNLIPGSFRGRRIVTPTSPPGVIGAWRGPNLLVDGFMEDVGVAAWFASNTTLTKQTADPYQGMRYLQSVNTAGANGYAAQDVLTAATSYRLTGVARSLAGNAFPAVFIVGPGFVWTGTTSTAWQLFDVVFTNGGAARIYFYTRGATIGWGTQWDFLHLSEE